jgi:hypothetical protein
VKVPSKTSPKFASANDRPVDQRRTTVLATRIAASIFSILALVSILASSDGCEAIIQDVVPGFTCTGTDLSGCPAGYYCKGVGCAACEKVDVCDGYDNDCNGKVDDGPLSDHDQDGYTVCGHTDPTTGDTVEDATKWAFLVDCNDNDPTVHPRAKEVCNGIDDNCDGIIDNPDLVCPPGQTCAPKLKECLDPQSVCTTANCAAPNVCDPNTQACVNPAANYPIGHTCASDEECVSTLCAFPALLGGIGTTAVCSKLCCTSNDCDTGFVCIDTGSGGRYCLDATTASRSTPGAVGGGASCGDGTACRSGLCTAGTCVDTCCSDSDCSNGTSCRLQTVGSHQGFSCGDSNGGGNGNGTCDSDDSCKSELCADYFDRNRCIAPCCTSANGACGSIDGNTVQVVCIETGLQGSTDLFPVCAGISGSGNGPFGAACTTNDDCASSNCDTLGSKTCTDVCCTNSDCPAGVCRPDGSGALRCVAS